MEIKPVLHTPNIPTDAPATLDSEANWSHLPEETKAHIISYLDLKSLAALAQTSKPDNKLVHDWAIREVVPTSKVRKFPDLETYLSTLERYSNLKCLNLSDVLINGKQINDDQFNPIITLCQEKGFRIEVLDLSGLQISLENCPSLPHLTELNLGWNTTVTDEALNQFLAGCPGLKTLHLDFTNISLAGAPSLTHLTELNLGLNKAVTDATLNKFLEGNKVIEKIDYSDTHISPDLVEEILRRRRKRNIGF